MTKIEFLEQLEARLRGISIVDRVRTLDYYSEMIDDCTENGMSEAEAVASLGDIGAIAEQIVNEAPSANRRGEGGAGGIGSIGGERRSADMDGREFSSVRVRVRSSDVRVFRSEDGEARVDCVDDESCRHRVFTEDGVLNIELEQEGRRLFERFFSFGSNRNFKVNIYLPQDEYDFLDIETMSGDVEVQRGFSFENAWVKSLSGDVDFFAAVHGELSLSSTSGDVHAEGGDEEKQSMSVTSVSGDLTVRGYRCEGGLFKSVSGDVRLARIFCAGELTVSSTSGDVRFESCDGADIRLGSVSGDIKGSLASGKHFSAKTTSGSIRLPKDNPAPNGECEAKTVSGSINLSICS